MLLTETFLKPYYDKGDCFPNLLARSVYLSKYRRPEDVRGWTDTVRRVVEGNTKLDPYVGVAEAQKLFDAIWNMRMLPPGRGLWTGGTPIPPAASFNCYGCVLRSPDDWCWLADMSMLGGGVGVSLLEIDKLPEVEEDGSWLAVRCSKDHPNYEEVSPDHDLYGAPVPDSREGWVWALKETLRRAFRGDMCTLDVSNIRPRGAPIKGFGGIACGPGPLVKMLRGVWGVVRGAAGRKLTSVECLDITTMIGDCIRSGNVRRSAIIVLGDPNDAEFAAAKKGDWFQTHPHRSNSNNSIMFAESPEGYDWDSFFAGMTPGSELPGIANLWLAHHTDRNVVTLNPCQPAWAEVLTPQGIRTFADIDAGSTIWSGKRWTKVVKKWSTGVKEVFRYRTTAGTVYATDNHRVVQNGVKVELKDAEAIDLAKGPRGPLEHYPSAIMDGLMIGDGMFHGAANKNFLLIGAKDGDYFSSEISGLIGRKSGCTDTTYHVDCDLPPLTKTFDRQVPEEYYQGHASLVASFLRGLYTANGSVVSNRVTLKTASKKLCEQVQAMLSSIGIRSYFTTNLTHSVKFKNGEYVCKESYDINISSDRDIFAEKIGFIQKYKTDKLKKTLGTGRDFKKSTFNVQTVTSEGFHEVFDITAEDDEHVYWHGGHLVSNCAEQFLEHRESCNLVEVFPAKGADWYTFRLATRYAMRQRLQDHHDPVSDEVGKRNRRIGVAVGGVCDISGLAELDLLDWKHTVRNAANDYARELGILPPITVTTVKPSGTISLLNDSSPGMHAPYAPFYIRRTRIAKNEPMAAALIEAGVPYEECVYDKTGNTWVFEFPMAKEASAYVTTESVEEQFARQSMLQDCYADNAVSATITYNEDEWSKLPGLFKQYIPVLKSTSVLARVHGFAQAPYQELTEEEYRRRVAAINHNHPLAAGEFEADECAGGVCPIR